MEALDAAAFDADALELLDSASRRRVGDTDRSAGAGLLLAPMVTTKSFDTMEIGEASSNAPVSDISSPSFNIPGRRTPPTAECKKTVRPWVQPVDARRKLRKLDCGIRKKNCNYIAKNCRAFPGCNVPQSRQK
jgi:hypothetical protein